jgi:Flp pilus assembly protein TadG
MMVGLTILRLCRQAGKNLRRLVREESGTVTALSLGLICCTLLLGGLAIDTGNAWRHREMMKMAADVASHAGVVALAKGESPKMAFEAADAAVIWNAPKRSAAKEALAKAAHMTGIASKEITLMHYDDASGTLTLDGPVNAVRVRMTRSEITNNPVPTFLLKLVGVPFFDVSAGSISAILETRRCSNSEGLFARGAMEFDRDVKVGSDVCLHSQKSIDFKANADFEPGSKLSVPDLANCIGGCALSRHPDLDAAAVNLQIPDISDRIAELYAGFVDPETQIDAEWEFFSDHPLSADLSALGEMQIDIARLEPGSLVTLTPMEFGKMREFPAGVIYSVTCDPEAVPAEDGLLLEGHGSSRELKGLVLVTNCALRFDPSVEIEGSIILTTFTGNGPAIIADVGARAADPSFGCNPALHTTFMSLGPVQVPSDFLASNVALVTAGDFSLSSGAGEAEVVHRGTSIHTGGELQVWGSHQFESCNTASSAILPTLRVIRRVMTAVTVPNVPAVTPPASEPDMPGTKPEWNAERPALLGSNEHGPDHNQRSSL